MEIPKEDFLKIVHHSLRTDIEFWKALSIVRKHYCGPMTVAGICPGKCVECKENLIATFSQREPGIGLLIWRLKDTMSKARETFHAKEKYKPKLSASSEENPFLGLIK